MKAPVPVGQPDLLATIADHIPIMLSVVDAAGRVLWTNAEWERVLGWTMAEARHTDLMARAFPDAGERAEVLRWVHSGRGWRDFRLPRKDGASVDTTWRIVRLPRGRFLAIGQDMTDRQRAEVELRASHERLRRLSGHAAAESERRRAQLARELHDELGQALTALKIDAVFVHGHLRDESPAHARVAGMIAAIDGIIATTRSISTRLRPPVLDRLGLLPALESLAREHERHVGVHCRFQVRGEVSTIAPGPATHVFRVVQEALTNVARHAKASRVDVRATAARGRLDIEVRDNGSGIPPAALDDVNSVGLLNMRERARLAGAELTIARAGRRGTVVRLSVPIPSSPPRRQPRQRRARRQRA